MFYYIYTASFTVIASSLAEKNRAVCLALFHNNIKILQNLFLQKNGAISVLFSCQVSSLQAVIYMVKNSVQCKLPRLIDYCIIKIILDLHGFNFQLHKHNNCSNSPFEFYQHCANPQEVMASQTQLWKAMMSCTIVKLDSL